MRVLKKDKDALAEQYKAGETIGGLLSELFFKYLQKAEFKEEKAIPIEIIEEKVPEVEEAIPLPSKIKILLEKIRKGLRRQCPKCFNMTREIIREVIAHENLIYDFGMDKIYGFKYVCGKYGHEWVTEKDWRIVEEE